MEVPTHVRAMYIRGSDMPQNIVLIYGTVLVV